MNSKAVIVVLAIANVILYFYVRKCEKKAKETSLNVITKIVVNEGSGMITIFNKLDKALITLVPSETEVYQEPLPYQPPIIATQIETAQVNF